jgi:CHASE2 domain-containing sensor protein
MAAGTNKITRSQGRKIPLRKRLLRTTPVLLGALVLTFMINRTGLLRELETYALDAQTRLQAPPTESDVAIVYITDADYVKIFQEKSPLDPAKLQNVIHAIARGRPKVIGVDIETNGQEFRKIQPSPDWPPIVWARNAVFSHRAGRFYLFNVLGGKNPAPISGLVVLKLDSDGAVRRYTRLVETQQGDFPSFAWAVVNEFSPDRIKKQKPSKEELFIKFAGDLEGSHRIYFTASGVLDISDGPGWQNNSPFKDKIVLLGGAYAASDEHDTPVGWLHGVETLAYIIETELQGGGMRPPGRIVIILLVVSATVVLCLLFQHFSPGKALLVSLVAVPLLAMACSLVAFWSLAFWAYFAPALIAVFSQQFFDQVKEYRSKFMKGLYEEVAGATEDADSSTVTTERIP